MTRIAPLLSMSDMLRCAKYVPAQPGQTSFDETEFQAALRAARTPRCRSTAARELLANADAVFKEVVNRSVAVAMQRCGAQMVNAVARHRRAQADGGQDALLLDQTCPPASSRTARRRTRCPPTDNNARQKRDTKVAKANQTYYDNKLQELAAKKADAKQEREEAKVEAERRKAARAGI